MLRKGLRLGFPSILEIFLNRGNYGLLWIQMQLTWLTSPRWLFIRRQISQFRLRRFVMRH